MFAKTNYDYVIVGAGFFGAICARELTNSGKSVLVIEKRGHLGGNCYTENVEGINVHKYGAHIFHTSNVVVWNWIRQYCEMNSFINRPIANYKGELYSLPFNMWTFNQLWGVLSPEQALKKLGETVVYTENPANLEEQALTMVGREVYEKLIKGYTEKQWMKNASDLPASIIKRLPLRFTYDNNYFNDTFQGIPVGGYTQIFEKLLGGIEVHLNCDWFALDTKPEGQLIFTGPIDLFYDYKFGRLEYKTVSLKDEILDIKDYQGNAVINFTDKETPFTRIIEHKHFEFGNQNFTVISKEFPVEYIPGITEPYYPVNDSLNNAIYEKYKMEAQKDGMLFGGRLGEYKYYDMHQVIESALLFVNNLLYR
jgi:UDP-galactopyranose mutase